MLDFGLAKISEDRARAETLASTEAPTELALTSPGTAMGTVAYMSPEQARGDELDGRTDLFSLGVVLYEGATGRQPFAGKTAGAVVHEILAGTPTAAARLNPELPEELERILGKLLEKDPRLRYQTAGDLKVDLQRLERETTAGALPAGSPAARPSLVPSPRKRWIGIAAAVSVVALAAVFWLGRGSRGPQPESLVAADPAPPSIAVLPFVNMSEDAANEYFSDGLSEELLNALVQIEELRVAGRTSSFQFKGKNEDLRVIGEKLNVASILEGSVRKAGNRLRITAQLVNAADGFHLWSRTYDRELDDIFAVQDDIARSVAAALEVTLLGEPPGGAERLGPSAEAYTAFLQGRHFHERSGKEAIARAVGYYEQALEIDPDFALAWAWLSIARGWQAENGWVATADGLSRSREAAERALALDGNLAEAWVAQGRILLRYDWDWAGADAAFRRAEELKPGDSEIVRRRAGLARTLGRLDEAVDLSRRAVELDPLNLQAHHSLSVVAYSAGRLDEAEAAIRKRLELDPSPSSAYFSLGEIHLARSEPQQALAAMERASPDWRLVGLPLAYHALGRHEEADAALAELIEREAETAAYQIAEVYSFRGEVDQAFAWLERAYRQRDSALAGVKTDPLLANLSTDPRYRDFLEKMRLADGSEGSAH